MNDNDELRVVVRTLLEANEDESAQHIASQLKSISEKVNAISKIKVGVELNSSKINSDIQKLGTQLSKAAGTQQVGVNLQLNPDSVSKFRTEMERLAVAPDITSAMTEQLDKMGVQIDKVSGSWKTVGDEEERLLSLQIQGTDLHKRTVSYLQTYDRETGEISTTLMNVTANLERQRKTEAAIAAQAERDNDNRIAWLTRQQQLLEDIRAKYTGATQAKGIFNKEHLKSLNTQYEHVAGEIDRLMTSSGALTSTQKAQVEALRSELERLFRTYQNLDYVATELRTKDVWTINGEFRNELDAYEKSLQATGQLTGDFQKRISALRDSLSKAFDASSLTAYQNAFDQLKGDVTSFQAGERLRAQISDINAEMNVMPTKLADVERRFQNIISPTETLKANMDQLRRLTSAVNNEQDANRKVEAYSRLQSTLKLVNAELSALTRMQNAGFRDDRLVTNLEKAKADLLTVGRTWSALKHDRGLNAQFEQLSVNLDKVQTQADFSKWRAQFSTFKSEVKAAGKNVQSLGDILKNNLGKVLQWVSATTLLFRAIRYLRQGLSTIVALNTAMIDLRKVTSATEEEYHKFYLTANETAKRLNMTTEAVISQTAEWARLGYAMQDAAKLAENSAIFAAVSPGMDQSEATDGLVSIIKAYGIDVEDTLDGIISKVNEVGNKFSVSNKDIVDAMTRSSSAMAAANNTFEETVALATAAIEITRDASTVGNGLKTLSMRIRGYDEETEELSDDVMALTGKIADLTKVTSNNNRGVSLFEVGDPNTYRSTYDILKDIAEIWDELTDKNRAQLLEALFGKRQAQIGSAILSNFSQAEDALVKMEQAAGSADREMEKIMSSVEYRLNALKETWVGVAQNMFQTDDMKAVISVLQGISDAVEALTEDIGLSGAVSIAGLVMGFNQLRAASASLHSTIVPVVQVINNLNLDNATDSFLMHTAALNGLDKTQARVALSMTNLSAQEQAYVMQLYRGIAVLQEKTVAEFALAAGVDAVKLAEQMKVGVDEQMNAAMLEQLVLEGSLDAASKQKILNLIAQTGATTGLTTATNTLNFSLTQSVKLMLATPMGWISLLITLLPIAIRLGGKFVEMWKEAHPTLDMLKEDLHGLEEEADSLNKSLEENNKRIDELENIEHPSLVEEDELRRLKRENELLEQQLETQQKLIDAKAADVSAKASGDAADWLSNADNRSRTMRIGGSQYNVDETSGAGGLLNAIDQYTKAKEQFDDAVASGNKSSEEIYQKQMTNAISSISALQDEAIDLRKTLDTDANKGNEVIQEQIHQIDELLDRAALAVGDDSAIQNIFDRFFSSESDLTTEKIDEFISYLERLGYDADSITTDNLTAMFNKSRVSAEEATNAISSLDEQIEKLKAATDNLTKLDKMGDTLSELAENGADAIPLDVLADFLDLIPEAAGEITSVADAQDRLRDKIAETERTARDAYAQMLISNQDYISGVVSGNENLLTTLQRCYGTDKTRFQQLANGKLQIEQALISELSGLWAKYSKYTTDELEKQLYYMNYLDPSPNMERINELQAIINLRRALEKDLTGMVNNRTTTGKTGAGSSSTKKATERYIAEIDRFREAQQRLAEEQERAAQIEGRLGRTDDLKEQIVYQRQLTDSYMAQQWALHNLNDERRKAIQEGVGKLRNLGFTVSYDPSSNNLFVENMEHLNELVAKDLTKYETMADMSVNVLGKYENITEATNGLIKDTEGIIENITAFNDANKDASAEWWELSDSIRAAKAQVKELLDEIVQQASEAVDSMQNVYDTLHSAADEYAASGYITVDTLQSIIGLGTKYLKYLMDENGQLVINEESIRGVIAARTEEMAVETAMSYIETVRIAHMENDVATLRDLTSTTLDASGATWELVYANAAILKQQGLADEYYDGMMNVIDGLRSLASSAVRSIGETANSVRDTLQSMKGGLDDILKYTMDMLKQRVNDQIDALQGMKDAYSEIIDQKKESLKASKAEADYQKTLTSKMKELAKLQARYDALGLDNSRAAQAERAAIAEEMAALQEDLADTQAEHTLDAAEDAYDKMEAAYHAEKDKEITILENSVLSYQKLYDMAISYISDHWDSLYGDLISWNNEYGNVLNSEITSAWDNAYSAAKRYGDFVSGLKNIDADISAASGSGGGNTSVGKTNYDHGTSKDATARAWVEQMERNSAAWHSASEKRKTELAAENVRIAQNELKSLGVKAHIEDGTWYLDDGRKLFDVYHNGGVVGDNSVKGNEKLSLLKDDEWVLSEKMVDHVSTMLDRFIKLQNVAIGTRDFFSGSLFTDALKPSNTVNNVTNSNSNQAVNINFGGTVINGVDGNTVQKHINVDRDMMNQIARMLGKSM